LILVGQSSTFLIFRLLPSKIGLKITSQSYRLVAQGAIGFNEPPDTRCSSTKACPTVFQHVRLAKSMLCQTMFEKLLVSTVSGSGQLKRAVESLPLF